MGMLARIARPRFALSGFLGADLGPSTICPLTSASLSVLRRPLRFKVLVCFSLHWQLTTSN